MATDYHKRPVMSVRVDAGLKEFADTEAKRPGMTLGGVVDEALADLRAKRAVNHVVDAAPAAAEGEQPEPASKNCRHPNMRMSKGVCPDCNEWVTK
jgi:hypothetical protein